MKNKFKLFFSATLIAIMAISFVACDDDEVKLANLDVTVEAASSFTGLSMADIYVYITNTVDGGVDSALTDASGIAAFINVAPGTYAVSATMELTDEEAGAASGYYEEMTLNAVENNVALLGGFDSEVTLTLDGKASSSLVIKEFYYSGANDPTWSILFKDQFVEIYNNSDEVVYADGLYLASLAPTTNGSDPSTDVALGLDLEQYIYADKVAQVPGSGTDYPIQPGESIIIAFNAVDWTDGGTNDFTVDLSIADFELYAVDWLESLGRTGNTWFDIDNADVTNMNMIYLNIENYGQFNFNSTGASIAIFRSETEPSTIITDPNSSETSPIYYMQINTADVIDGIDMLYDAEAALYKRLPAGIDAGFNYVEGSSYTSQSVRRKVAKTVDGRKILQDTNNSTNDFEVLALPTPGGFEN